MRVVVVNLSSRCGTGKVPSQEKKRGIKKGGGTRDDVD